ncbi:Hsp70 family protein [Rickettsia endosymbiont of Cardiosporidium cionae]|uniref:Hsp70 family protein n=1 Tax=Rickettsia endosymbiont of Cardiosporidium cionae TaxID=2777155 RepID=UPI0018938CDD|nr:Hsp70 family protein [Rickettsia endosymbiont of Cardiosporidium cionae]KAF8818925.1 Fe-S protein assembly chaperone HscA [Rickettsia endosymbiont of Cardiosporidium cionae]
MQILDIEDKINQGLVDKNIVAIDFGTSNSLAAIAKNDKVIIIKDHLEREIIPSIITLNNSKVIIGDRDQKKFTIRSIKRLLAKSYAEILENPLLKNNITNDLTIKNEKLPKICWINNQYTDFTTIAANIFAYLKASAELQLNSKIIYSVVSVPAYFNDNAKGQILLAAKIAGFEVIRLIMEPTAAAYAYNFHKLKNGQYLVYDLGGGTFDISILQMENDVLQVLAVKGDNMIGGDNIDQILLEYLLQEKKISKNTSGLLNIIKNIKELLSKDIKVDFIIDSINYVISREEFEQIIMSLILKTIKIVQDLIIETQISKFDGIILVGGSSKIPLISTELKKILQDTTIYSYIDPDKAVVIGAALQAQNLSEPNKDFTNRALLIDVVPLSLGIELYGGITEKIIPRNSPIPCTVMKEFTTYVDNQSAIKIHILQGESEMVENCRSLALFELNNLSQSKAGELRLEVTFTIDVNGILSVTAREKHSSKLHNIDIKPSYGLNQCDIETDIQNAYKNLHIDFKSKMLVETKINARYLINDIQRFLQKKSDPLINDQQNEILNVIKLLEQHIELNKYNEIIFYTQKLRDLVSQLIKN